MHRYDVAIVGAGVAGLSLAWHLQRLGKRVIVLEKSARAEGASTRNFGMIWVVGQADLELENLAIRSRDLWSTAADELGFWIRQVGSLHLAYEPEEVQVLKEFLELTENRHGRHILSPSETTEKCAQVRREGLLASLYSPTEAAVDPREVVHSASTALIEKGVEIRFDSHVTKIESDRLILADETSLDAEKIVVCPGPDLFSIYPDACRRSGLTESHLQMLRLRPKTGVPPIGIHLCAGLTLGHYANFRKCPSIREVIELHHRKWPTQVEHGIHVLVAEHPDGTITVGDSHSYGRNRPIYREEAVDEAILQGLDEFLPRDNYEITQRWIGTYNTHESLPYWTAEIGKNIWAMNLFGTGMTLSFAITERLSKQLG